MFSFRFRVDVAPGCAVASDAPRLPLLETSEGQQVELAGFGDESISKSSRLVLRADGWVTRGEAENAGNRLADALTLALVRSRVGVESWARRGGGMFFPGGLRMLEEQIGQRVLNDLAGLTVYESSPPARFASMSAKATRGASVKLFVDSFRMVASTRIDLTERERVAIDLFNASFFEPAADTRLLTLVMAIEALLDLAPRPSDSIALVDTFIGMVQTSSLAESERTSLGGALRWLRRESIRSAGRRLAQQRLGETIYNGQPAPQFFTYCYDLRSDLVHGGNIRKAREEAGAAAAQLELFVSDLLMSRFLGLGAKRDG